MTKTQKHYNYMWRLIHRLERELLYKGFTRPELDRIREEEYKKEEKEISPEEGKEYENSI